MLSMYSAGSSGVLELQRHEDGDSACDPLPWMLEAAPSSYLYLSVPGRRQAPGVCQTPTRLVVSAPDLTEPLAVICPGGTDMVSDGRASLLTHCHVLQLI